MKKYLFFLFLLISSTSYSQFPINSLFTQYNAITFLSNDSSNFILDEVTSYDNLRKTIKKECPFSIYNAEHLDDIIPFNIITPILGLHNQVPAFDTILQEVEGIFTIDTFVKKWYAYYNKSTIDTETAFFIIPGTGTHNGWHIAAADTDYHNFPTPIKDKCLQHGDVYTYVKPNEDFRGIWKDIGSAYYKKLNYSYFTPFTDFGGNNWAANMMIECTAAVKCLKLKYNKVIVLGLSNGGFPALVAGIEGEADGINCASGISILDYDGFPLDNFENPYYYNLFNKYSLDSVKFKIENSSAYYLFSFGNGDCCSNAYEYATHSLQDTLSTLSNVCKIDFTYNFNGHHFPIAYLDTFITNVKLDTCAPSPLPIIQNKIESEKVLVYPNPAQQKITIESESSLIQSVQVYSLLGEEIVFQKNIHASKTNIFLPSIPKGNYIVNIVTSTKNYAKLISIIR